jgi:dihydroorotate dehydrogenase (fumarate)
MELTTKFLGLNLKNPIIAGSSGLTANLSGILELEHNGVAAIVLKSLFEEQIIFNYKEKLREVDLEVQYPEAHDYINQHTKKKAVEDYLELIVNCKKILSIPVIASINCVTPYEWTSFAHQIEQAGADALELNMFFIPADPQRMSVAVEETYLSILHEVVRKVSLPVCVKLSPYFSGLSNSLLRFSFTGIKGMVLFNRFFPPDIDIEELKVISGPVYSNPDEIYLPMRWIAMLSDRIYCDLAASSGIHDGKDLVKVLLAGAKAAEIASVFYSKGPGEVGSMLKFLEEYLKRHKFSSVSDIIGKMSIRQIDNPADYERVQYIKYYSGIE